MQLARVYGSAQATVKTQALQGWRLVVVQPLLADGSADGDPQLVVDPLGARVGDEVMLTTDGAWVRELMKSKQTPVRYAVLGIVDERAEA